jgi:hypothetical protein
VTFRINKRISRPGGQALRGARAAAAGGSPAGG